VLRPRLPGGLSDPFVRSAPPQNRSAQVAGVSSTSTPATAAA